MIEQTLPDTGAHGEAEQPCDGQVAVVVDSTGAFSAEVVGRMLRIGTFTSILKQSTAQVRYAGKSLCFAARVNIYWTLVLFNAWMQHFQALEPAWQRNQSAAGTGDGSAVTDAGLMRLISFSGSTKGITVRPDMRAGRAEAKSRKRARTMRRRSLSVPRCEWCIRIECR